MQKKGMKIWERREKCMGLREKWACKGEEEGRSARNESVKRGREGKCLTGERGSWRTVTEAMFTRQLAVS